jgi:hypothetical protein
MYQVKKSTASFVARRLLACSMSDKPPPPDLTTLCHPGQLCEELASQTLICCAKTLDNMVSIHILTTSLNTLPLT